MLNAGAADPVVVFSVAPVRSAVAYAPNPKNATYPRSSNPAYPTTMLRPSPRSMNTITVPSTSEITAPTSKGIVASTPTMTSRTMMRVPGCSRTIVRTVALAAVPRRVQPHEHSSDPAKNSAAPSQVRPPVAGL